MPRIPPGLGFFVNNFNAFWFCPPAEREKPSLRDGKASSRSSPKMQGALLSPGCDAGGEAGWHKPVVERVCYDRGRGPEGFPGTGGLTKMAALPVLDSQQQEITLVCLY